MRHPPSAGLVSAVASAIPFGNSPSTQVARSDSVTRTSVEVRSSRRKVTGPEYLLILNIRSRDW